MGKQFLIRTSVLNIPLSEWQKIPKGADCVIGDIDYFIKTFGKNLSFLSAKMNKEEMEFTELYFKTITQ